MSRDSKINIYQARVPKYVHPRVCHMHIHGMRIIAPCMYEHDSKINIYQARVPKYVHPRVCHMHIHGMRIIAPCMYEHDSKINIYQARVPKYVHPRVCDTYAHVMVQYYYVTNVQSNTYHAILSKFMCPNHVYPPVCM
jgi:hypothetical protein